MDINDHQIVRFSRVEQFELEENRTDLESTNFRNRIVRFLKSPTGIMVSVVAVTLLSGGVAILIKLLSNRQVNLINNTNMGQDINTTLIATHTNQTYQNSTTLENLTPKNISFFSNNTESKWTETTTTSNTKFTETIIELEKKIKDLEADNDINEYLKSLWLGEAHLEIAQYYKNTDKLKYKKELTTAFDKYENYDAASELADLILTEIIPDNEKAFNLYSLAADNYISDGWLGKAKMLDNNHAIREKYNPTEQVILKTYKKGLDSFTDKNDKLYKEIINRIDNQIKNHLLNADKEHSLNNYKAESISLNLASELGNRNARIRSLNLILSGKIGNNKDIIRSIRILTRMANKGNNDAFKTLENWHQTCREFNNEFCIDVEQYRLLEANKKIADAVSRYNIIDNELIQILTDQELFIDIHKSIKELSKKLWKMAIKDVKSGNYDDRSLYWQRLKLQKSIREYKGTVLTSKQKRLLTSTIDTFSRGYSNLKFDKSAKLKILLTGFDPYGLDSSIESLNTSGLIALALNSENININGTNAQIKTIIFPVRYTDFDEGVVERLLFPLFENNKIDIAITTSMGRSNFDLERFAGLNRSADEPDNQYIITGASKTNPIPPYLNGSILTGEEFLESSLPIEKIKLVQGPWSINDNRIIVTKEIGEYTAKALTDIKGNISVEGSGGGFLSNEVTYRAMRIRDNLVSSIPTGHIHTPRIFNNAMADKLIDQTKEMITIAVKAIK